MQRIFLSYRRSDTAGEAHALKALLEHRLKDTQVFIDVDDIPPGTNWPTRIEDELARSAAVIILAGAGWRGPADTDDRFADPDDWVRREVERALATKDERILLVSVDGAPVQFEELPASMRPISLRQGVPLTPERWDDDVMQIAEWAGKVLGAGIDLTGTSYPPPDEVKRLAPALEPPVIDAIMEGGSAEGWIVRPTVVPGTDRVDNHELFKVFEFSSFARAFGFMGLVASEAERRRHHPDWHNVWNRVEVSQRTWDAGHVVTILDFQMASFMNKAAADVNDAPQSPWSPD